MVHYCPVCCDSMIYDPATDEWYCIECEFAMPANLKTPALDKGKSVCYTHNRPHRRRTPVRLRIAVLRN